MTVYEDLTADINSSLAARAKFEELLLKFGSAARRFDWKATEEFAAEAAMHLDVMLVNIAAAYKRLERE